MNARYAFLLSRQYKQINLEADTARRDLYTFIYPKIRGAIHRGDTNVTFNGGVSDEVRQMLAAEHYVVILHGLSVQIDWSFDDKAPN